MSENCFIKKSVPLGTFAQSYLTETESQDNVPSDTTFGGILSDNKFAWYANGPRFQVVDVRRGKTIAGWCFGSIVKDNTTKVICVTEIPMLSRETPMLVVGLEYLSTGGTICIFDVLTSKVLRALQLKEKISSLHVIDGGNNLLPLQGPLRSFDGVIGVGCIGGDILLIDLCRHSIEEEQDRDEVDTCQIMELTCKDLPNLEYHKQRLQNGVHLAINLKGSTNYINNRKCGPDIAITALSYCPQLASLIVGYSFGAWQLWELLKMKCVYTSPTYDKNVPLSHFAIQEPSDDPKPVCYIWAIYSCYKEISTTYPLAVLYSVNYAIKEFHDGYGVLYEEFEGCMVRYQMELGFNSPNKSKTSPETNILRLTTYKSNCSKLSSPDNHEDTLSICYMAWNMYGSDGVKSYLGLFDLNQWYKAQMPAYNDEESANYLSVVCVTDLIGNNDFLLDVAIDEGSVKQFLGVQKPEEHYYPTALSFEISCCEEKVTHFICHRGQQRTLLKSIEESDSLIFLKPQEICKTAQKLGLTPIFFDSSINNAPGKFLLSLALEHQMIGWLCKCVKIWSNGRFKSSGFTLDFFLDWAWNRAGDLKANADSLTIPLFDYSETIIDANNQRIMNVCINQLKHLLTIYEYILNQLEEYILHNDIINQQYSSLQMVVVHFEVIQWMVNSGLLPENEETFLYPVEPFISYYNTRRLEIQNAHYEQFSSKESLLFIDILLKNEFSDMTLQEYWKEDDGNGCYPPPSIQSLLRTYLIDNVNFSVKHTILIYAFLDLSMALDRDNSRNTFIITQLIKFPTIFRINSSITALSQAFWHLDHKDFTSALDLLLDPVILNNDLKLWHHRVVINSLLIQKQYNLALTYYQIRKPPLKEVDDIIKLISLYVKNDMIHEAIEFQREHVNRNNQETILTHLYRECNEVKQLKKILEYALTETEERVIMKYLKDVSHPQQEELEVMYYVKRFRYTDIMKASRGRQSAVAAPSGLQGQKMISYKESVANRLAGFFPKVSSDLFQVCQNQKEVFQNKVNSKPQPLSVVIHRSDQQAKYKSSLIQMSMVQARETWKNPINNESRASENCPFIRTPLTLTLPTRKRSLICPKIVQIDENVDDENMESPCKKQKLQPRQSIGSVSIKKSSNESLNLSNVSATKLLTPLVKRKVRRLSGQSLEGSGNLTTCTPQSILKVRNLINSSAVQENQSPSTSKIIPSPLSLGLTPRKPTARLSVHFESSANESRSIDNLEQISGFMNISAIPRPEEISEAKISEIKRIGSLIDESKIAQSKIDESKIDDPSKDPSSDDVFYSPESSLEDCSSTIPHKETTIEIQSTNSSPIHNQVTGRSSYKDKTPEKPKDISIQKTISDSSVIQSPKMKQDTSVFKESSTEEKKQSNISKSPVVKSPRSAKSRGRKSLSRMVLENNALSTLSPSVKKSIRYSLNSPKLKTSLSSILKEDDSSSSNQSVGKDKLEESSVVESNDSKNSSFDQSIYSPKRRIQRRRAISSSKCTSVESKEIVSLNSTEESTTEVQQLNQEDVSMEQENKEDQTEKEADSPMISPQTPDTTHESITEKQGEITVESSKEAEIEEEKNHQQLEEQETNEDQSEKRDDSLMISSGSAASVKEWIEKVRVTSVPSRSSFFQSTKYQEIFTCDTTTEEESITQEEEKLNQEMPKINENKIEEAEEQKIEDNPKETPTEEEGQCIIEPIQEEISVADESVNVNMEQDVEMEVAIEEDLSQNVQEVIELSDPTIIDKSTTEEPIEIPIQIEQSPQKEQTPQIEQPPQNEQSLQTESTKIETAENLTFEANDNDKTINKGFITSTNVIEISDSSSSDNSLTESTEEEGDLNKAMIDTNETTRKQTDSNPPSDKSTIGSSSEDSFESNSSFKWGYESSQYEGQEETFEEIETEVEEVETEIEEIETEIETELEEIETEVGEMETEVAEIETEVEEIQKETVDQGIQVTFIQEDVGIVEEDGVVHNWAMEEEVQNEHEPFLSILVTGEDEVKLELTQNTDDELESLKLEVDEIKEEIKEEYVTSDDLQVENVIHETVEINYEEIVSTQDSTQIQDLEGNIQEKSTKSEENEEQKKSFEEPVQHEKNTNEKLEEKENKSPKVLETVIEQSPAPLQKIIEDTNEEESKPLIIEKKSEGKVLKPQPSSSNADVSNKKQPKLSKEKVPHVVLYDILKSMEMRALRGLSIDRVIPKEESEGPRTPSRRLSRSASADPDMPVRKSRRLAGLGLTEAGDVSNVSLQSPSMRTRRSSMSQLGSSDEKVLGKNETQFKKIEKLEKEKESKKETQFKKFEKLEKEKETKSKEGVEKPPQRRSKRSKSDCDIDIQVKVPVKRNTRSNSMSSTLPTISENVATSSTNLRSGLRSTRSRSKTPDKSVPETSTRSLRKGNLEQIPEEPEMPAQQPKAKKGRPRKGSTK